MRDQSEIVVVWLARREGRNASGHAVACAAGAQLLGLAEPELAVDRNTAGQPLLLVRTASDSRLRQLDIAMSISHTSGLVAVAVSRCGPVGIDVEPLRELRAVGLARRWFRPEESTWVESQAPHLQAHAFLWLWTRKEAMGKALGTGLARGGLIRAVPLPRSLPEPIGKDRQLVAVGGVEGLTLAAVDAPRGYVLAVAGGAGTEGAYVEVVHC